MSMALAATKTEAKSDLVNHSTDWGIAVSEAKGKRSLAMTSLAIAGYAILFSGSMLAIPIMAGLILFPASEGIIREIGIVGLFVVLAIYFNAQSRKGPKNSLQIDYAAEEVRLGSVNAHGAFVRHRVCPFRQIDEVSIDTRDEDSPALCLTLNGEIATIHFTRTDPVKLADIAAQISAASEAAKAAPVRSRIQSTFNGFEANIREVGHRVRSRVTSRFA